jgi:hypothetical protein
LKNEWKPQSLFFAAARMRPSSNSRTASSRMTCQLSRSSRSSGNFSVEMTGSFGTAENMYIRTL